MWLNQCSLWCVQDELLKEWDALPSVLTTSAREGDGRQALLQYIAQLRDLFNGAVPVRSRKTVEDIDAHNSVGQEDV